MKLNGTHQLLVYTDDVNILGGRVHTVKGNRATYVVARKEIDLEQHASTWSCLETSMQGKVTTGIYVVNTVIG